MIRRSSKNILSFTLLFIVLNFQGFSQQSSKVGIIHSQKIFETSSEGKKAVAQLREKEDKIKKELARLDERIRNLQTKFNIQRLTLSEEALMQLSSDLERASTERKRYEEDSTRDYQRLQVRLWQKVRNEVVPIIEQLAKEKRLDVVLEVAPPSIIVYFNPANDITDEVIKRYNASKSK